METSSTEKSQPASSKSNTGSQGPIPQRSNSQSSIHGHVHRQSFAENQRHPSASSPRNQRHPSLTQQAVQDLLNHPPTNRHPNPRFAGRDWRNVALGELATAEHVKWADLDTSVEQATHTLLKNNPSNVVLVAENKTMKQPVSTFDYSDLNTYVLVVVGLVQPTTEQFKQISLKAQAQTPVFLREIRDFCCHGEIVTLPVDSTLDKAMEVFGGGVHRVLVTSHDGSIVGILNQLQVIEFFWNEAVNFPAIDRLYSGLIRDLQIGSQQVIAINADAPLADALMLMHNEGLSSIAVVDSGLNVMGNISSADLRHVISAAHLARLQQSAMHFISVVLSERGVERGRDSFPVFYVNPSSTLAHTVAKLVATRSHRMWIVESVSPNLSPSPSNPATPLGLVEQNPLSASTNPPAVIDPSTSSISPSAPQSPLSGQAFASIPASALPGAHLSGRLTGVVSLTDILNIFAKTGGLHPPDPSNQRARRRRSSSGSMRPSLDGSRTSLDFRR